MPVCSLASNQQLTSNSINSSAEALTVQLDYEESGRGPGDARRHPCLSEQVLGNTWDLREIDLVDLLRVEKLLGILEIHLLTNEYVEQIRIDVAVELELA